MWILRLKGLNDSLRHRCNLTLASDVCEAALRSGPPTYFRCELPEVRFEFPFKLISKSTMAFLTSKSWRVLKDFGASSQT